MTDRPHLPAGLSISLVHWDDRAARALRDAQQDELRALYDGDSEPGVKPTAADVTAFLILSDEGGQALGCGGLRHLGDDAGEVKRMYVVPPARGRQLAAVILGALEDHAAGLGWRWLRLETGPLQQAAVALYTRHGYRPIPNFGPYAASTSSLCFEKELAV